MHCIQRLADYQNSMIIQSITDMARSLSMLADQMTTMLEVTGTVIDKQKSLDSKLKDDGHDLQSR